ncbi:conserved protein of unknown function [Tenacibaculum sp. 190130A14a]|uniref:Uncharacterized protein n=1 Tax=Tenacibaculum polynesiense TaxID=3137857 RepID=A0ABM9PC27_9FLAO
MKSRYHNNPCIKKEYYSLFFIIFSLFFSCCQNVKLKEQYAFKKELNRVVEKYIENTPLDMDTYNFSHPSYHLYLRKIKKDTILTLIQFPHLNRFDIDPDYQEEGEATYSEIEPNGWCLYKNKYPIIVFDKMDSNNKLVNKEQLLENIPDSLMIVKQGKCYVKNPNKTNYALVNGIFVKI